MYTKKYLPKKSNEDTKFKFMENFQESRLLRVEENSIWSVLLEVFFYSTSAFKSNQESY